MLWSARHACKMTWTVGGDPTGLTFGLVSMGSAYAGDPGSDAASPEWHRPYAELASARSPRERWRRLHASPHKSALGIMRGARRRLALRVGLGVQHGVVGRVLVGDQGSVPRRFRRGRALAVEEGHRV